MNKFAYYNEMGVRVDFVGVDDMKVVDLTVFRLPIQVIGGGGCSLADPSCLLSLESLCSSPSQTSCTTEIYLILGCLRHLIRVHVLVPLLG